jgi:hypothetical protein
MPKSSRNAANDVVTSIEQVAALYGVRAYRMQSRVMTVVGAGGRTRPMFMGAWRDQLGQIHYKGMADLLLTPRIPMFTVPMTIKLKDGTEEQEPGLYVPRRMDCAVALWVEAKSGSGRLSPEQELFRDDVLKAGAFWIQAQDGPDDVLQWFENMGVRR